jgi:hypothetical protein
MRHVLHALCPTESWYFPSTQSLQRVAPTTFEALPTSQLSHELLSLLPEYVPGAHEVQELDPTVLNVPASQEEQVADPLWLLFPAEQSAQESEPPPPTLFLPGLQSLHVAVLPSENEPAGQVSQDLDPDTLSDFSPTRQAEQGVASASDFFPATQGTHSLAPEGL